MAHFAEIDSSNKVLRVLVVSDADQHRGQEFLANDLSLGGTWIQTSYNTRGGIHILGGTPFRKNYAGIGYTYDPQRDAFIPPKPANMLSFVIDEETCLWIPPIPYPLDRYFYSWDETDQKWVKRENLAPVPPSWIWHNLTKSWRAPVPYPGDGKYYTWSEETLSWIESTPPARATTT